MHLTSEQEKMLRGEYGWAVAKAMEIIVKVGEAIGAESLVEIKHAHVSGISFSNIGKYGLEFIEAFSSTGGRARVFTTVNPGCIDYSGYSSIIDNVYEKEQYLIDKALVEMRFKPVFTCIPYYYRPPAVNEHLAWGESSAVIFANSIYGARTNREGGPLALASALTGYTYNAGLHLNENRVAKIHLKVHLEITARYYGALGLWIGENVKESPLKLSIDNMNLSKIYEIKNLLASAAATGNHALIVVENLTPKGTYSEDLQDRVEVASSDVEKYLANPPKTRSGFVLGYIGCPHVHPKELLDVVRLLNKYGPVRKGKLLITVPREFANKYWYLVRKAKALGADVAAGTCPVVSKLRGIFDYVLTNSGKAYFYLRRIHGLKVGIASTEEIVKYVC
ncbi:MAG: aconitase X catalytic domain-containing protein [Desulfurococcaceae archaeon]